MPTISVTLPVSGTTITAGLHSANYSAIQTLLNGGLDTSNWASGKIFAPSKLIQEGATSNQVIQWNGTSWVPASITVTTPGYATTLPGSPTDGQEAILVDSTTAPTFAQRFRFNAISAKWDFIGGSSQYAEITTAEATTSATYAALATAGPSIALSRAGDYFVEIGYDLSAGTNAHPARMSYDIGGTGAVDADCLVANALSNFPQAVGMRARKKTGIAVSTTLTAKYKTDGNSMTFENRWMRVTPITVT